MGTRLRLSNLSLRPCYSYNDHRTYHSARLPILAPIIAKSQIITPMPPLEMGSSDKDESLCSTQRDFFDPGQTMLNIQDLPAPNDKNFEDSVLQLIRCASNVYDLTDKDVKDSLYVKVKTRALINLTVLCENVFTPQIFTMQIKDNLYEMIINNIFRPIPLDFLPNDHMEVFVDPLWPHLVYCYQILGRAIILDPNYSFLDPNFIDNLFGLSMYPDAKERSQITSILRTLGLLRKDLLPQILKRCRELLKMLKENMISPFAATTILGLLGSFIKPGNTAVNEIIKEDVVPLMFCEYAIVFQQQYNRIIEYSAIDHCQFFSSLMKHWPYSSYTKQKMFISLILWSALKLPEKVQRDNRKRFSLFMASHVIDPNFDVAASCLDFLMIDPLPPILYSKATALQDSLLFAAYAHWSEDIRLKARQVIQNAKSFKILKKTQFNIKEQKRRIRNGNTGAHNWRKIVEIAWKRDKDLDAQKLLDDIKEKYKNSEDLQNRLITAPVVVSNSRGGTSRR